MVYIYILTRNKIPFYVGKSKDPTRRKHKHYQKYGNDIDLEIIDEVKEDNWKYWESFWIEEYKKLGYVLLNQNKGGGGPTKWAEEQKILINPNRILKIKNHKTRGKNISKTLKERNHSKYYTKEIRNKISDKLKGISKVFTEEHKINLSKANLESKGKIVECYDLQDNFIENFPCLREAKNWLIKRKTNTSNNVDKQIKDCCNGRQKTCHGYKFKYKQNG